MHLDLSLDDLLFGGRMMDTTENNSVNDNGDRDIMAAVLNNLREVSDYLFLDSRRYDAVLGGTDR